MRNMIIDLSWLLDHPREIQKFHWQLEGENSDLDGELARFQDQVEVDLTLTNEGKYIVVQALLLYWFACGSCLEWYSWPLRVEFPSSCVMRLRTRAWKMKISSGTMTTRLMSVRWYWKI